MARSRSRQRSDAGAAYLGQHDAAIRWARANRRIIATRMLGFIGCEANRILDICHNSVTACPLEGPDIYLHRKGAAPATKAPSSSPAHAATSVTSWTPPGTATATSTRSRTAPAASGIATPPRASSARKQPKPDLLRRTKFGSRVICDDKALLFEEVPEAYKPIGQIVGALEQAGMIRVIAVLTPMLTYKTRSA